MPLIPAAFLTAQWRNLVMLNYEIDPAILQKRLPKGTELDFWNDKTYVSLVGFRFLETRVLGRRVPFHINFDEVNLRFYVRHKSGNEWRRGVVFVKEIVPRLAIALVARWAYNEQYVALLMKSVIDLPTATNGHQGSVSYSWKWANRWHELFAQISGEPIPLATGSEAEFITEHYWGYAAQRDGSTLEYQVEHPSWRVWHADQTRFTGDVAMLYGTDFVDLLSRPPTSAFVAEGSEIMVRHGLPTRID
ncbi:MAG TPA: DUF2071 domain-containing protein [Schlesneria sp.]|jgi:hypothetical protein